jgi:hypothetical protein
MTCWHDIRGEDLDAGDINREGLAVPSLPKPFGS